MSDKRPTKLLVQRGNGNKRPWTVVASIGFDWTVLGCYLTKEAAEAAIRRTWAPSYEEIDRFRFRKEIAR